MMAKGRPLVWARADKTAQQFPMDCVTGRMFVGTSELTKISSSHSTSWWRRLLSGRSSMPRRISAKVNTLT